MKHHYVFDAFLQVPLKALEDLKKLNSPKPIPMPKPRLNPVKVEDVAPVKKEDKVNPMRVFNGMSENSMILFGGARNTAASGPSAAVEGAVGGSDDVSMVITWAEETKGKCRMRIVPKHECICVYMVLHMCDTKGMQIWEKIKLEEKVQKWCNVCVFERDFWYKRISYKACSNWS